MVSFAIPSGTINLLVFGSHVFTWLSSIIVVGITGYFLDNYAHDQHLTFEIVVSALVLAFWIPSFVLPFLGVGTRTGVYKNYYLLLDAGFSYLWLTAFIFAAQDYNESSCWANAPSVGHCSLKLANEAFIFLAFFFTLVALGAGLLAWGGPVRDETAPAPAFNDKEVRPGVEGQV